MMHEERVTLYVVLTLTLLLAPQTSQSLRLLAVKVPAYKLRGEAAVLECQYQLQGTEKLYTVKWYKENEEFYRFVPKHSPSQTSYKVDGIKIDHQQSNDTTLTLKSVSLKTTGLYRCEVSAEAPSFASAQGSARLEVLVLPTNGPHITGEKDLYMPGDKVNLTCTSGKSFPPSHLKWLLNDQEVTSREHLIHYPLQTHPHGLLTSTLGLRLAVSPHHFQGGALKLRCVASVSPVLWQGDQESVVQTPALLVNREAMLLVRSAATHPRCTVILPLILAAMLFYWSHL